MDAATLAKLVRILNPDNEPGRLTLIHRFGAGRHRSTRCRRMIDAVREQRTARSSGSATRCTATRNRLRRASRRGASKTSSRKSNPHSGSTRRTGSILGGVHFELTGDDVTECTGGARGLTDGDLARAYHTTVDPRLNYEQALELAMLIGRQRSAASDI